MPMVKDTATRISLDLDFPPQAVISALPQRMSEKWLLLNSETWHAQSAY
jgi:hypothetical protein